MPYRTADGNHTLSIKYENDSGLSSTISVPLETTISLCSPPLCPDGGVS